MGRVSIQNQIIPHFIYFSNLPGDKNYPPLHRLLTSYSLHSLIFSFMAQQPPFPPKWGRALLIIEASRSQSDTPNSVGLLWTSDRPVA